MFIQRSIDIRAGSVHILWLGWALMLAANGGTGKVACAQDVVPQVDPELNNMVFIVEDAASDDVEPDELTEFFKILFDDDQQKDGPTPPLDAEAAKKKAAEDEEAAKKKKAAEEEAAAKKKKIAEALKKAIDPKRAERLKKEQKAVDEATAEKAKKEAEELELKAILPQFEMQVRPLVRSRYNFIRTVARPSREQRGKLVAKAEEAQTAIVRAFAEAQLKMQKGQWTGDSRYPDGRQLVNDRFGEYAKDILNPEQLDRYNKEVERKNEHFKSTCIKNLVAMIDQQLVLTPDQRDKIGDALNKKWDKKWVLSLDIFMYGEQFMPQLPNDVVLDHLNPLQKEVWNASPRNGGTIWGGFGNLVGNQNENEPLDKDFPKKAEPPAADAKQAAEKAVNEALKANPAPEAAIEAKAAEAAKDDKPDAAPAPSAVAPPPPAGEAPKDAKLEEAPKAKKEDKAESGKP